MEIFQSLVVISDFFTDIQQFEWMLDVSLKVYKQILPNDPSSLESVLIRSILKSASFAIIVIENCSLHNQFVRGSSRLFDIRLPLVEFMNTMGLIHLKKRILDQTLRNFSEDLNYESSEIVKFKSWKVNQRIETFTPHSKMWEMPNDLVWL